MHCRVHKAAVTVEALYISRAIVPIDTKGVDGRVRIVGIGVQEFHNPTEIVWLAGRFAHEVHMVYTYLVSLRHSNNGRAETKAMICGVQGFGTSANCERAGQRSVEKGCSGLDAYR